MSLIQRQPARDHPGVARMVHVTGAFIAGASVLLGCITTVTILWVLFRTQPLISTAALMLLLFALSFCGVRRTKMILAVVFALGGCCFFGCLLSTTISGGLPFSNSGWLRRPLTVLGLAGVGWVFSVIFFRLFLVKGYDMWRRIDQGTLTDFASIFALFAARVTYYFLPSQTLVNSHVLWVWLAYYVFYRLIKWCLFRLFDLNRPDPLDSSPLSAEYLPQS